MEPPKSAVTDHKSICIYSLHDKLNVTLHLSIQTKKTIIENTETIAFEICRSEFIRCTVKPKKARSGSDTESFISKKESKK